MIEKKRKTIRRSKRVRARVKGKVSCPRLSVFCSGRYIYAQIINDEKGQTLVSAGPKDLVVLKGTKSKKARATGEVLAKKALKKGIKKVVFDRGSRLYHGRVKALADGARKGGLNF